jgi:hypothetical protein
VGCRGQGVSCLLCLFRPLHCTCCCCCNQQSSASSQWPVQSVQSAALVFGLLWFGLLWSWSLVFGGDRRRRRARARARSACLSSQCLSACRWQCNVQCSTVQWPRIGSWQLVARAQGLLLATCYLLSRVKLCTLQPGAWKLASCSRHMPPPPPPLAKSTGRSSRQGCKYRCSR